MRNKYKDFYTKVCNIYRCITKVCKIWYREEDKFYMMKNLNFRMDKQLIKKE